MIYVMSDIHGCYKEYLKALKKIDFKDEDQLYVLGDMIDRGDEPIQLLLDMMSRHNVFPLLGNHEYMALSVLRKLCVEITEENVESHLSEEDMINYITWMENGGNTTIEQFKKLTKEEQEDILDYLEECLLIEEMNVNGNDYVLVHAGLEPFDENKDVFDYRLDELIFKSPNYQKQYFKNKYLITGHTPTVALDLSKKGEIIELNHHIAIDCGCVFGLNLGVFCLENHKKYYWWLFYAFSALAVMAKGIPGFVVPFGSMFFVSIVSSSKLDPILSHQSAQ